VLPSGRHLIRPPLYGVPMLLVGVAVTAVGVRGVREARTG
jgi:hypothetical protein